MRPDKSGNGPLNRESRPGANGTALENKTTSTDNYNDELVQIQRASRYLSRRHLLSLPIATIIAAELFSGAAR